MPINRLVDWVDQSLLCLHLGEKGDDACTKLRGLGVRTATDIVDLMESEQRIDGLSRVLNQKDDDGPAILECIHTTLRDEPNFFHVRAWKSFPRTTLAKYPDQTVLRGVPQPSGTRENVVQAPAKTEPRTDGALAEGSIE